MKYEPRQKAFTQVELLVTLAVFIVTLAIGVPFYDSIVGNNRAAAMTNELVSAINMAKSEAITRGESVTVCADHTDAGYTKCGTDWTNGWFLYSGGVSAASATVVKVWEPLERSASISASSGMVTYSSEGFNGDATNITFDLKNTNGNLERCVTVTSVGLIRVERNACP